MTDRSFCNRFQDLELSIKDPLTEMAPQTVADIWSSDPIVFYTKPDQPFIWETPRSPFLLDQVNQVGDTCESAGLIFGQYAWTFSWEAEIQDGTGDIILDTYPAITTNGLFGDDTKLIIDFSDGTLQFIGTWIVTLTAQIWSSSDLNFP